MTDRRAIEDCYRLATSAHPVSTPAEFARLFAAHHDFVWRTLGYLGVAKPAQDDATQDVFIVLYRRFNRYDPAIPIRAWLFGIMRRVADKYRVKAARPPLLRLLPDPDSPSPEDELARSEARSMVEAFLAGLPGDQREVFILAELEGLTAPEIAAATQVNLNTTYSRLRLARRSFERAISRHQARWQREGRDVEA